MCRYLAYTVIGVGAAADVTCLLVRDMSLLLGLVELSVSPSGKDLGSLIGARLFVRLDGGRVLLTPWLLLPGILINFLMSE